MSHAAICLWDDCSQAQAAWYQGLHTLLQCLIP